MQQIIILNLIFRIINSTDYIIDSYCFVVVFKNFIIGLKYFKNTYILFLPIIKQSHEFTRVKAKNPAELISKAEKLGINQAH